MGTRKKVIVAVAGLALVAATALPLVAQAGKEKAACDSTKPACSVEKPACDSEARAKAGCATQKPKCGAEKPAAPACGPRKCK